MHHHLIGHTPAAPRRVRAVRLLAASFAGVLAAGMALTPTAVADPIVDPRRDAEQRAAAAEARAGDLQASIEGFSVELGQAVLDLRATQARLPAAQAELAAAQETLERSQREAALIADRLESAQAQQSALSAAIAADDTRSQEIRVSLGQLARRASRGQTAMLELDLIMNAETTQDFVRSYSQLSTALRVQTRTLEELQEIETTNRNGQARLSAVEDRIVELTAAAEQKVLEADTARSAAQARQEEIERLIADQSARQQTIAGMKAQAEAEQTQLDAQRNAIAAELADIIARERAAADAARAAAAASGQKPPPAAPAPSGSVSGALFTNPTSIDPMYVTSEYGMRLHPILGYTRLHAGIDLRTYCDTPLYAPRDGRVRWAEWRGGFGNQVMLDYGTVDGNSLMSSSNHLTRSVVSAGQQVSRGQLIGYSGNTGLSGACHLHFEVYVNGSTVNPRPLLGR